MLEKIHCWFLSGHRDELIAFNPSWGYTDGTTFATFQCKQCGRIRTRKIANGLINREAHQLERQLGLRR